MYFMVKKDIVIFIGLAFCVVNNGLSWHIARFQA